MPVFPVVLIEQEPILVFDQSFGFGSAQPQHKHSMSRKLKIVHHRDDHHHCCRNPYLCLLLPRLYNSPSNKLKKETSRSQKLTQKVQKNKSASTMWPAKILKIFFCSNFTYKMPSSSQSYQIATHRLCRLII